ncbi:hypothetical protein OUZ56_012495 [Daphnia magna]|uniref:Uncharacterized protein n=1 Tax=Daphnia magna TaxID=35525 RepID=A0ABQ9Z367_9CRUS|nr:hypothetical protein OUZ56_012495 [Daphnia magna]
MRTGVFLEEEEVETDRKAASLGPLNPEDARFRRNKPTGGDLKRVSLLDSLPLFNVDLILATFDKVEKSRIQLGKSVDVAMFHFDVHPVEHDILTCGVTDPSRTYFSHADHPW